MALKATSDVIYREVAGEAFLVPIRGRLADIRELIVLNEVGRWLWVRLDGTQSIDQLVEGLTAEFDVSAEQARRETETFLAELAGAGFAEEALP
jgi:hypothetical protein